MWSESAYGKRGGGAEPLCWSILLLLLLLWTPMAQADTLRFHVSGAVGSRIEGSVRLLGKERKLDFTKDGSLWTAGLESEPSRYGLLSLKGRSGGAKMQTLYSGLVRLGSGERDIWIDLDIPLRRGHQLSGPGTRAELLSSEQRWLSFRAFWICIALALVGLVLRRSGGGNRAETKEWPVWTSPLFFLSFSALWNGPMLFGEGLPGLHHDSLGTFWLLSSAPSWESFRDASTAWPEGASYGRLDSFVLYALSWLGAPDLVYRGLLLLGPALSAWAAGAFARSLGARRPWSWLAGLGYAFAGLGATAALEGHVYMLLQPWLPLFALTWWKATQEGGRARDAVAAGAYFSLCLLTSAYVGLCAAVAAICFWVGSQGWKRRAPWLALLPALPCCLIYLHLFSASGTGDARPAEALMAGSASLANLLGHTPETDRAGHAQAIGFLGISFGLAAASFRLLRKGEGGRILLASACVSLLLALGPFFCLEAGLPLFPLPLKLLRRLPLLDGIGFPIRLGWTYLLCISVLGALSLTRLAQRSAWAPALLVLCALEALASPMLPLRQSSFSLETPSAYQDADGPVFDLFPMVLPFVRAFDPELSFTATACIFQLSHGRPIADNCVATDPSLHPRVQILRWAAPLLMSGDHQELREGFEEMGFSSIAFFPDLFQAVDRRRIQSTLSMIDPAPGTSADGGLLASVHRLSPDGGGGSIPSSVPARKWGFGTPSNVTELSVSLLPADRGGSYHLGIGQEEPLRLHRGQASMDPLYSLRLVRSFSEAIPLRLTGTDGAPIWEGELVPSLEKEQLTVVEGEGPWVAAPVANSPKAAPADGSGALRGWIGILFCLAWLLSHRKDGSP
jgi:hypothetical protein